MKKVFCSIVIFTLILITTACTAPNAKKTEPTVTSAVAKSETLVFNDSALEEKVRKAMNKLTGDITTEEAKAVLKLDLSNASFDDMNSKNGGIKDISSLQYFTGLEELNLSFNEISDFAPLAEIKSLKTLGFTGVRPKDLSVLKGLTNMVCLIFDWGYAPDQGHNGYENLDFITNMKNLEIFEAKGAGIKNIAALSTLTKLWSVFLEGNQITDISPLANLKNLKELLLSGNPIKDYSPVKDIYPNLEAKDFELK